MPIVGRGDVRDPRSPHRCRPAAVGLALGVVVIAAGFGPAAASCIPDRIFANWSEAEGATYIHFGPDAAQDNDAIVGRFWQAGSRAAGNEGTYDDSQWLYPYPAGADDHWSFHGFAGAAGVVGCPRGEMILAVQDVSADGKDALVAVGRVTEIPALVPEYDFARIHSDWTALSIPMPVPTRMRRAGGSLRVDLSLGDLGGAYYGLPGTAPDQTITAYRIVVAAGDADPGRSASAWTLARRVPYAGSATTTTDLALDCRDHRASWLIAIGLEFDNGQLDSDYVGRPLVVSCNPADSNPSFGRAPGDGSRGG